MKHYFITTLLVFLFNTKALGGFTITLNYSGDEQYRGFFTNAINLWQSYIVGYVNGYDSSSGTQATGLLLNASFKNIDGAGGTLAQAGPTFALFDDAGYVLATEGDMEFDTSDFSLSTFSAEDLSAIILHEMAHVIGIGSLWEYNNLCVPGSGQYTGANALFHYKDEFNQPNATFIPAELAGGPGTADAHWNEVDGGAGLTGINSKYSNRDLAFELMTGWYNGNAFISRMTLGGFQDLGYLVIIIPEPSSCLYMIIPSLIFLMKRKRHSVPS